MFAGLQLVAHAALGLFEALHTLLHLKVLLSIPPQYSVADLRTRFWYFVSDAATVPLSLLALSFGLHNTSLRTLLVSSVLGHAALHLAYVWAWPSGEARTLRDLVRRLLGQSNSSQSSVLHPIEDVAANRSNRPYAVSEPSIHSHQHSCKAQPSPEGDDDVLRDAAPHVKAVLRWSAAPSWADKRACANSNLQVLGTSFDIAVHVAMLAGHLRVLSALSA